MAPTFSHLSLPIRTNENAIKISKLWQRQQCPTF
jgi:hypothetical protein